MEKINFCRTLFEETRFMSLLIKSTLSSIVARHGLNPYQAHLLGEISSQDGQTIKELAYHLCVKPSNFKPIAQPLEERGPHRTQAGRKRQAQLPYLPHGKGRAESAAIDAEFSALFEENPDAAELQQQVIEGFIASVSSQASTASSKPSLPIPTQERKTRWVSPVIK